MKKTMLIGAQGQIGWELQRTLTPLGELFTFTQETLDLSQLPRLKNVIRELAPDIIVNAAAYTAVDLAETEREKVMAINGIAPGILAEEARRLNALLVHFSTDYVFNGVQSIPYQEEEMPQPLNFYGESKLAGEKAIQAIGGRYFILRTSWVYGLRGRNFLTTMLKMAQEHAEIKIVDDQIGVPNWSRLIAEATAQLAALSLEEKIHAPRWGLYHLTSEGQTSWYDYALAVFQLYKRDRPSFRMPEVIPISTKEKIFPAVRPAYSVLSNEKLKRSFGISLPPWEKALELCLG